LCVNKISKFDVPTSNKIRSNPISITKEPSKVYKKKKKAALIFRSLEPQIPMIKNIGIKILSKKI